MNTNNAPVLAINKTQRGCALDWLNDHTREDGVENRASQLIDYVKYLESQKPRVSESDEAVAREIVNGNLVRKLQDEGHEGTVAFVASILARHRQPAAVSADAVDARRVSENISFAIRHRVSENSVKQTFEAPLTKTHDQIMGEIVLTHLSVLLIDVATPIIQAYGDARELNGARKMQDAAYKAAIHAGSKYASIRTMPFGEPSFESGLLNGQVSACGECGLSIRALSPETVVGGGE